MAWFILILFIILFGMAIYDCFYVDYKAGVLPCVFGFHDYQQEFGTPYLTCTRCGQMDTYL